MSERVTVLLICPTNLQHPANLPRATDNSAPADRKQTKDLTRVDEPKQISPPDSHVQISSGQVKLLEFVAFVPPPQAAGWQRIDDSQGSVLTARRLKASACLMCALFSTYSRHSEGAADLKDFAGAQSRCSQYVAHRFVEKVCPTAFSTVYLMICGEAAANVLAMGERVSSARFAENEQTHFEKDLDYQ